MSNETLDINRAATRRAATLFVSACALVIGACYIVLKDYDAVKEITYSNQLLGVDRQSTIDQLTVEQKRNDQRFDEQMKAFASLDKAVTRLNTILEQRQ